MKPRSPVMGFNHNVRHLGRVYHVQTEDSGVKNPHLFTHVFFGGTILATKKVVYDMGADELMVRALMQKQHKDMLRELKAGTHDDRIRAFFTKIGQPAELLGEGPLESEPEEIDPRGGASVQQAMAAASQWEQMAAKAAKEKPSDEIDPFAGRDDDAPVITLTPPPVLNPPPRAPSRAATPAAPTARKSEPPRHDDDDDDAPVITLTPPPMMTPSTAEPASPKPGPSTMARRIWAKKGGSAERPFDDSGVFNALAGAATSRQQSGELTSKPSAKMTGPAEIVDVPPPTSPTPPPMQAPSPAALRSTQKQGMPPVQQQPPPVEEGPVVVLAPPRPQQPRPMAEPAAPPNTSPRGSPRRPTPPRVQIAAPSADGVVIARPPSVVVSGSVQSGAPSRPVPPVHSKPATTPPAAAAGTKPTKPPAAPREAPADSIFGEDLISEKSLDEVILAYLAEDAKHQK